MKTPREATRGLDCWVTRLAAYSQLDQFATNVDAAREAARRGDYEAAAALMGRTVGLLPSTVGSVRETMRFARSAATLNTENVRRYLAACFAAGTPIVGEYGSRPVEDYRVGDKVWARNENDPYGPLALKEIEECFQTEAEIWHVHVGGQVIRATAEHPFWVVGRGWIETKHLRRGDVLIGRDGPETVVDETLATGAMERVYNFRVADYHTYFVGEDGWHFDVWAHNACEVIPRRGMNKTTRSSGANSATVYGRAQRPTGNSNDPHAREINGWVNDIIAREGRDIAYITLNRSLSTATGRLSGSRIRPDIIIVYKNGRIGIREVGSQGQDNQYFQQLTQAAMDTLPARRRTLPQWILLGDYRHGTD